MSSLVVTKTRIQAGIWEGVVTGAGSENAPKIEVVHDGAPIRSVTLTPDARSGGAWHLRIAVPPEKIADGIQTFLIRDPDTDATLASFSVATGDQATDGLDAEVALLRAELDMLKQAFRRYCREHD